MSDHENRLHAEIDRQLTEIRAACDGLATRAGLLIAATGVASAIVAARLDKSHHQILLILTLVAFGIATVLGASTLLPWLKPGPESSYMRAWMASKPSSTTSSKLYDTKVTILEANIKRWAVMRDIFVGQEIMTILAVALALGYSAWK